MLRNLLDAAAGLPGPVLPGEELLADLGRGHSQDWLQPR